MKNINERLQTKEAFKTNNITPLQFGDRDGLYYVESGNVNLFAVPILSDDTFGARYHIATYETGDLIFPLVGMDCHAFLAIGTQNTSISVKSRQEFFQLYKKEGYEAECDAALFKWIEKTTTNINRNTTTFRTACLLTEDRIEPYPVNNSIYSTVLKWIKASNNTFAFNAQATSKWIEGGWFPVTVKHSIYLKEDLEISVENTASLLRQGRFEENLFLYIKRISRLLLEEKEKTIKTENEGIDEKQRRSEKYFSASLQKIRSVLDLKSPLYCDESISESSTLFRAAQAVTSEMGISIFSPPGKEYSFEDNGTEEIAKDNNIRGREILLRGNWWKEDNGPILGRLRIQEKDQEKDSAPVFTPVALIPCSNYSYYMLNPLTGEQINLDESLANKIDPRAFMFYRSLPNRKLSLKDILQFTGRGMKRDLVRYAFLGVLGSLIGLLIPEMTRMFFDRIIPEAARNQMIQISFLIFISAVTVGIFELVKGITMTRLETKSDSSLQAAVMDRVMKMPVPFFRDYTTGDLSERTMAISRIRRLLSGTVMASLMSFLFSLVYLFQIFKYSKDLAKLGSLLCLIPISITILVGVLQYHYEKEVAELQGSISGTLLQFLMGVAKLNITSSEKQAFGVWADKFTRKKEMAFKSGFVNNLHATFLSFFPLVVSMIFYIKYIESLSEPETVLSTGTFLAFIASFTAFQAALISMVKSLTQSINILPLYNRAKPILHSVPEISVSKPTVSKLQGQIEINQVNFRYTENGPLILNDVSMRIEPGEFVALVGESGSGKSTLLRLLLGFEKAESGSLYFDNQDIDSLDITSLRRQFGVVLQNGSIMKGSIFNNIVGSSSLTIEDAWSAAEMVGFDEDIKKMPMGMHTELPAGGWTLSGGQRQRLIIAKAIIRKPNILFFDEATSALDNQTQMIVSKSLENLNVTRLVIAHRLSTIINADTIYVLQNGVITESGNYRKLMAKKGYFYELAKRQQV